MSLTRDQITAPLLHEIESWPFAIACWEGGSAANSRADHYSDLDLMITVEDGTSEEALRRITDFFAGKIRHTWRVPEPSWHGHSQIFVQPEGAPEFFFLDVLVMRASTPEERRFLEPKRHGRPVIYFDRREFLVSPSADTAEFRAKRSARLSQIRASFPFYEILVAKEIRRGRALDALGFYRSLLGMLVELMGMKYRPLRYDFGLRYLSFDFPADQREELERMAFVGGIAELEFNLPAISRKAKSLFNDL